MYLSDLCLPRYRETAWQLLKDVPVERYSLWEWKDALNYMTHDGATDDLTAEQARDLLVERLGRDLSPAGMGVARA